MKRETVEKDQGRFGTRRYYQSAQLARLADFSKLEKLASVGMVQPMRQENRKPTNENRYLLSSYRWVWKPSPKRCLDIGELGTSSTGSWPCGLGRIKTEPERDTLPKIWPRSAAFLSIYSKRILPRNGESAANSSTRACITRISYAYWVLRCVRPDYD